MALLKILHIPDPKLTQPAKPVETFDDELQTLIDDMFETMYDAPGVGLAATQVGIDKRLAVIDIVGDKKQQYVLINPDVLERKNEVEMEEGCLSVPGATAKLKRASWVKMHAQDRFGKEYELAAEGLLAECIQHEIDHLDGKLYIDYVSRLKRQLIREKVKKHIRLSKKNK